MPWVIIAVLLLLIAMRVISLTSFEGVMAALMVTVAIMIAARLIEGRRGT